MRFDQLGLAEPILRAVAAEGYSIPTPIQLQAVPHVLAGKDLLGCAQTGTGKTAAFALPILHRLSQAHEGKNPASKLAPEIGRRIRPIRTLVLAPTRELASQIGQSFRVYGQHTGLRGVIIYGGVNQNRQTAALHGGADIVVATPGRLLDLMNQGYVDLSKLEILVLDEADQMLDMGFIHDIRRIVAKVPPVRQTLFFSATMPPEIRKLSDSILKNPVSVQVAPISATADNVEQSIYHVKKKNKPALLAHLLSDPNFTRSLVFTRTKSGANRVVAELDRVGIASEAIHGNKSQASRERAIQNFKTGKSLVLVATDIAARGLDIDDISHVVNYDLPNVPETYVHRIGRTARAGASGTAVSFCDPEERPHLKAIERLTRKTLAVNTEQPVYAAADPSHETHERRHAPSHRPSRGSSTHHGSPRGRSETRNQPSHREKSASRDHSSLRDHATSRDQSARRDHSTSRDQNSHRDHSTSKDRSNSHAPTGPATDTKAAPRRDRPAHGRKPAPGHAKHAASATPQSQKRRNRRTRRGGPRV